MEKTFHNEQSQLLHREVLLRCFNFAPLPLLKYTVLYIQKCKEL